MAARNLNSENTDNVHIARDASDEVAIMSLPLGIDETKNFGTAIANEKFIKEVGELLKQMGQALKDDYDLPQTEELRSFQERFSGFIQKVFSTVGIVLDWLEASAANAKVKDNHKKHANVDKTNTQDQLDYPDGNVENDGQFEKKENVLRGLYHIAALGSHTTLVGLLELACKVLDLPENAYKAKQEHIKECLKEFEVQKENVFTLVEKACDLMEKITSETSDYRRKASEIEFNRIVRQANVIIESCKDFLSDADETIEELIKITSVLKNFSRVLRFLGWGATCYTAYKITYSSPSVDSLANSIPSTGLSLLRKLAIGSGLKGVSFATVCVASGYAWLSFLPSRVFTFRNDLENLKLKHRRLKKALHHLERRLKSAVDEVNEHARQSSNREDDV